MVAGKGAPRLRHSLYRDPLAAGEPRLSEEIGQEIDADVAPVRVGKAHAAPVAHHVLGVLAGAGVGPSMPRARSARSRSRLLMGPWAGIRRPGR